MRKQKWLLYPFTLVICIALCACGKTVMIRDVWSEDASDHNEDSTVTTESLDFAALIQNGFEEINDAARLNGTWSTDIEDGYAKFFDFEEDGAFHYYEWYDGNFDYEDEVFGTTDYCDGGGFLYAYDELTDEESAGGYIVGIDSNTLYLDTFCGKYYLYKDNIHNSLIINSDSNEDNCLIERDYESGPGGNFGLYSESISNIDAGQKRDATISDFVGSWSLVMPENSSTLEIVSNGTWSSYNLFTDYYGSGTYVLGNDEIILISSDNTFSNVAFFNNEDMLELDNGMQFRRRM